MTAFYQDRILLQSGNRPTLSPAEVNRCLRYEIQQVVQSLERAFKQPLAVIDCSTGSELQTAHGSLAYELGNRLAMCQTIAERGRAEILDEMSPLLLLAVPLPTRAVEPSCVALAMFLTERVDREEQITAAAREFGIDPGQAFHWAQGQTPWPPHAIQEISQAITENAALQLSAVQLKRQLADLSAHLLHTFEEITLLHRLTKHLSISKGITELCRLSVAWLAAVVPAKCIVIWLNSSSDLHDQAAIQQGMEEQPVLICHGECPIEEHEFESFIERLGPHVATEPIVLNRSATSVPTWFYPDVREVTSVPIREGNRHFGWLLALNHTGAGNVTNSEVEFGTVEACLMASIATILGIHSGNTALYHEQSDLFASVVRALTSAIDAKDQYTCGHSDRVARLAVCLARRLGCSKEELDTIYLSGLLHDIGKIGIDDNVLRKPGSLTPDELEHIKTHPDLGCHILDGIKQLDKVLPVVRHHHEAWDGEGYPGGFQREATPNLARILAVADSIDAMSSDRPYRKGFPDEKVDAILREGAGKQWDPNVIATVFQVRDELRRIGEQERAPLLLKGKHGPGQGSLTSAIADFPAI
ncbi:MAG: HD-GYP domain-containing protein [Planctomycetes bacterium]|nr:HD-GYP domain-containing protein [Planctomycetota bacterium]